MSLNGTELLEYACMRFGEEKYDEALEAFVLAYCKGIEKDWILENIYNCYMLGNEATFEHTYVQLQENAGVSYEQCTLDFIPYREGEYYIYDKEMMFFRGVFSIHEFENTSEQILEQMEYSAIALEMDWNWNDYKSILTEAKKRKLYVVSHNIGRMSSFFKIPELREYTKNIVVFSNRKVFQDYFHQNTSVYLPHAVIGNEEEKKNLLAIIKEEHQYRLTPEGRNTENVLFTIGIPTHARGNILLKRLAHLRQMPFDAEIEFAISKNGTTLYEEEYAQVNKIEDARINYYDHGKELRPEENWHYAVEMAHGKYVLLISDEDDVCLDALEHYMKLFTDFPETVIFRARGANFYNDIREQMIAKAGLSAFTNVFLRQNYLSGLIVKRDIFLLQKFMQLEKFASNEYYRRYPHDLWCTLLSLKGDYIEEPVQLFVEVDAVLVEENEAYEMMGKGKMEDSLVGDTQLPIYSTYEERFMQFQGQVEFLHILTDNHPELVESGILKIIGKLSWLMEIARNYHYKTEMFLDVVDEFVNVSMQAMDEFQLSAESQIKILGFIKKCAMDMQIYHEKMCTVEKEGKHD